MILPELWEILSQMKVLVLEDDKIAQLGIRKILSNLPFQVDIVLVENGQQGLDYLIQHPGECPDMILLDINMPVMNGHEFLKAIRNNPQWTDLPVVIHTTSDNPTDIRTSRDLGIMGYFVKHVDYSQYRSNLENIIFYWAESKQKNAVTPANSFRSARQI